MTPEMMQNLQKNMAEMQKMRKCGEGMQGMPMPGQFFPQDEAEQASRTHVCD